MQIIGWLQIIKDNNIAHRNIVRARKGINVLVALNRNCLSRRDVIGRWQLGFAVNDGAAGNENRRTYQHKNFAHYWPPSMRSRPPIYFCKPFGMAMAPLAS